MFDEPSGKSTAVCPGLITPITAAGRAEHALAVLGVRAGNAATNTDPPGPFRGGIADRPGARKARYYAADG